MSRSLIRGGVKRPIIITRETGPRQMLLQICSHTTSHYTQTDESEFHSPFFRQVAVTNCGTFSFFPSISAISSLVRQRSAAPTFPFDLLRVARADDGAGH